MEYINDSFDYFLKASIFEEILLFSLFAILLLCFFLFIYFIFNILNTSLLSYQKDKAVVVGKSFTPSSQTNTYYLSSNNIMMPIYNFKPDCYYLLLSVNGSIGHKIVTKEQYESAKDGDNVDVVYAKCRFTIELMFK